MRLLSHFHCPIPFGRKTLEEHGEPAATRRRTSAQCRSDPLDSASYDGDHARQTRAHRLAPGPAPTARSHSFGLASADYARLKVMTFRVLVKIAFVDGSDQDVPINVQANDETGVRRLVTPEYMNNVTDDWGVPIANVTVVKAEAREK
jgi:hypothetical protein